jgi:hypothetical protein
MPTLMPSIFKYFVTVGAILFVGLVGLNAVMESGGPGPRIVQDSPKAKLVRHDPRASLVERLREEEAAQKASGKAEALPVPQPATAALSTAATPAAPARPAVNPAAAVAQPQPMKQAAAEPVPVAPAAPAVADHRSAPAALTGVPTEDETHSARVAQEKAAAEKARKKRVARDRARTKAIEEASAARQQDQYYYGQRSAYAAPPRPAFGPFGQNQGSLFGGGWGRGW